MSDRIFSALIGLLVIPFYGAILALGQTRIFDGWLADPDCFVRLMRVARLVETGAWYDGFEPLLNAPDGLVMHWTRPFDVLLVLMTLPGLLVTNFETSLYWTGVVISPLLAVVALGFLVWGALALLPRWGSVVMAAMFFAAPGLYGVFQLGRPDHHSLLLVLAAATLALMVRWATSSGRHGLAGWAGLAVALSMWVGTEALLTLFIGMAGFGLLWLMGRHDGADALLRFALMFAIGVVVAIAIERPPSDWFVVEADRISLVHAVLAVALLAGAGLIAVTARLRPAWSIGRRLVVSCCAGLIPAVVLVIFFPEFFNGPYGAVAPEVRDVFLANVSEAQPLFDRGPESISEALFALGPIMFAVPFAIWRIRRGTAGERSAYTILLLALAVYIAGALYQVRLIPYGELVLVWLWAAVVAALIHALPNMGPRPWNSLVCAGAIIVVLVCHIVLAATFAQPEQRVAKLDDDEDCDWQAVAEYLRQSAPTGVVLTYIYTGPELAWRTGLGVMAAPYHRNEAGILDADRIFLAPPEDARLIMEERDVSFVVMCLVEPGRGGHDWYVRTGGSDSFYGQLSNGNLPVWVGRVGENLPEIDKFKLFRIN